MDTGQTRFLCPSEDLNLRRLLKKGYPIFMASLVLALIVHLSLMSWRGLVQQNKTAKPLTTRFVKRRPRLTKPLEMKKRPRPVQRQMQRKMISVKAKADRQKISGGLRTAAMIQNLSKPSVYLGRQAILQSRTLEPDVIAETIRSDREDKDKAREIYRKNFTLPSPPEGGEGD